MVRSGHSGTQTTDVRLKPDIQANQAGVAGRGDVNEQDQFGAPESLLTPSEVAALFRVNPKTVTRWARAGKLTAIRTLGGHRRFRASEIRRCLEEMSAGEP